MREVNMGKVGNKNKNHKEFKKANIRRNEKIDREKEKIINARVEAALEKERVEWAITDKEDEKYQRKIADKMTDKGPSQRQANKAAHEAEMEEMENAAKKK